MRENQETNNARIRSVALKKSIEYVIGVLEYTVLLLFFIIVSTAFLQVFFRYVFNTSITWANDLVILLMIWAVWLCAPIGLYQKTHLQVNFFEGKFSKRTQSILTALFDLLILILLIILGVKGIEVIQSVAGMTQLILPIPTGVTFASAPVGAFLMIYVLIPECIEAFKNLSMKSSR